MASKQQKDFCVLYFARSQPVITVQPEFRIKYCTEHLKVVQAVSGNWMPKGKSPGLPGVSRSYISGTYTLRSPEFNPLRPWGYVKHLVFIPHLSTSLPKLTTHLPCFTNSK